MGSWDVATKPRMLVRTGVAQGDATSAEDPPRRKVRRRELTFWSVKSDDDDDSCVVVIVVVVVVVVSGDGEVDCNRDGTKSDVDDDDCNGWDLGGSRFPSSSNSTSLLSL